VLGGSTRQSIRPFKAVWSFDSHLPILQPLRNRTSYFPCSAGPTTTSYLLAQWTMTVNSPSAHRHKPLRIPSPFDLDVGSWLARHSARIDYLTDRGRSAVWPLVNDYGNGKNQWIWSCRGSSLRVPQVWFNVSRRFFELCRIGSFPSVFCSYCPMKLRFGGC
jgi:hypothetical protein